MAASTSKGGSSPMALEATRALSVCSLAIRSVSHAPPSLFSTADRSPEKAPAAGAALALVGALERARALAGGYGTGLRLNDRAISEGPG